MVPREGESITKTARASPVEARVQHEESTRASRRSKRCCSSRGESTGGEEIGKARVPSESEKTQVSS